MQEIKDACVAVMMLCEVAAYCKSQGKTLWDAMLDMYEKYGYYKEGLAHDHLKGNRWSTADPGYDGQGKKRTAIRIWKIQSAGSP